MKTPDVLEREEETSVSKETEIEFAGIDGTVEAENATPAEEKKKSRLAKLIPPGIPCLLIVGLLFYYIGTRFIKFLAILIAFLPFSGRAIIPCE